MRSLSVLTVTSSSRMRLELLITLPKPSSMSFVMFHWRLVSLPRGFYVFGCASERQQTDRVVVVHEPRGDVGRSRGYKGQVAISVHQEQFTAVESWAIGCLIEHIDVLAY